VSDLTPLSAPAPGLFKKLSKLYKCHQCEFFLTKDRRLLEPAPATVTVPDFSSVSIPSIIQIPALVLIQLICVYFFKQKVLDCIQRFKFFGKTTTQKFNKSNKVMKLYMSYRGTFFLTKVRWLLVPVPVTVTVPVPVFFLSLVSILSIIQIPALVFLLLCSIYYFELNVLEYKQKFTFFCKTSTQKFKFFSNLPNLLVLSNLKLGTDPRILDTDSRSLLVSRRETLLPIFLQQKGFQSQYKLKYARYTKRFFLNPLIKFSVVKNNVAQIKDFLSLDPDPDPKKITRIKKIISNNSNGFFYD